MATFLLTWNPSKGTGDGVGKLARQMRAGNEVEPWNWSTGSRKHIKKGDRVFFLRQGTEPRGVCGSGWVTRGWYTRPHWETGKKGKANYVDFKFDALIDPDIDLILTQGMLRSNPKLANVQWNTPASGISVSEHAAKELEKLWAEHYQKTRPLDEDDEEEDSGQYEGDPTKHLVIHRRREQKLRRAKIAAVIKAGNGRLVCEVPGCGFDFEKKYGPLGAGYAQVHHLKPLGGNEGRIKTKLSDLAIVCANCHVMIHRGGECRLMEGLVGP